MELSLKVKSSAFHSVQVDPTQSIELSIHGHSAGLIHSGVTNLTPEKCPFLSPSSRGQRLFGRNFLAFSSFQSAIPAVALIGEGEGKEGEKKKGEILGKGRYYYR